MKSCLLFPLLLASACTDSTATEPLPPPGELPAITFTLQSAPLLVAYREAADAQWRPADAVDATTYRFQVKGPYVLTIVCGLGHHIWVQQILQTPEDEDVPAACELDSGSNRLMGRTIQSANVYTFLGIRNSSEAEPFEFLVPSGTYDVIARAADRIAIRRRVKVEGDTVITNPIDLTTEGRAFTPAVISVTNPLPEENRGVRVELHTQFGFYWGHAGAFDDTPIIPDQVLLASDRQYVTVYAGSRHGGRRVMRNFREGDSTSFTLPDRMGPVSFTETANAVSVSWSSLPERDRMRFIVGGSSVLSPLFVIFEAIVSRSFEDSAGMTSLGFDTAIPGYLSEWHLDPTKEYDQTLSVERDVGNDRLISSRGARVNVPPVEPVPPAIGRAYSLFRPRYMQHQP